MEEKAKLALFFSDLSLEARKVKMQSQLWLSSQYIISSPRSVWKISAWYFLKYMVSEDQYEIFTVL